MTSDSWRLVLTEDAEQDYLHILDQSEALFGPGQADIYEDHLLTALAALENGPDPVGSVARSDIRPDLRVFSVRRRGVSARHLICYRTAPGQVIEVLRILHDAMDLPRHIAPDDGRP